jgi:type I restriction enzyme, S subunit
VNPRYAVKKGQVYPFVEMAAVGEDFQGILRTSNRAVEGSGLARFRCHDTLFAKITPCPQNGKVAFVDSLDGEVGLGSTEFIVLSPRDDCDPRFLYHLAGCHDVRGRAVARMEGSTGRQRVPDEVFTKRLLVPIPPREDQRAIADFLNAIDDVITRARSAAAHALRTRIALAQKLFAEGTRKEPQRQTVIGMLPESWDVIPLRDVVTEFQYGLSTAMQEAGQVPILRMGNLQGGNVILEDLKYVTLADESLNRYLINRGDVLFNRTNSQELVGKVGIYRHNAPAVFASYLIRLHLDLERVDPYFVGQVLNTYSVQCRIKRYATPGVQQVNVNATNLGRVLVPVPSGEQGLTDQREIAAILEDADLKVRTYASVVAGLKALKNSLMPSLFSGQIRVPVGDRHE